MKLLKFEATWCGPCQAMKSVALKVSQEHALDLVSIDIDENPDLARRYGVYSIPTILLVDGDKELARVIGAMPAPKLAKSLGLVL